MDYEAKELFEDAQWKYGEALEYALALDELIDLLEEDLNRVAAKQEKAELAKEQAQTVTVE